MISESVLFFKNLNPFVANAKYLQGVPNMNETFTVKIVPRNDGVEFQKGNSNQKMFFLNKNDIQKISVEDQTTVQSRVGFTRLLLVGIFAFAWKKRQNLPLSFLIFDYKDEFGDTQEMFIQSEDKRGFQEFTNIKYHLQKYWKEAEENPNFDKVLNASDKKYNEDKADSENKALFGCLFFIAIIVIVWIISVFIR